MKTLKLYEIITLNEISENEILIELMLPYKNSLLTYYKNYFCNEPILMITSVFNAAQYGKIVSSDNFTEELINFIGDPDCVDKDNENFGEYETICFNSIMLSEL